MTSATALPREALRLPVAAAHRTRRRLEEAGVVAVLLSGPSGSGKSALIRATAARLGDAVRVAAVVAHPVAAADAQRLSEDVRTVVAVHTPALTPEDLDDAIDQVDLRQIDLLLIEASPQQCGDELVDLGETYSVPVFSAAGGDEKAQASAADIAAAGLVLLSKADLLPYVSFDRFRFEGDVKRINPEARVLEVSPRSGEGMAQWISWLEMRTFEARFRRGEGRGEDVPAEAWFG